MEPIRSAENPAYRQLAALLKGARERRELGLAVVEGPHLVLEALSSGRVRELWATPEALEGADAPALKTAAGRAGQKPRGISAGLFKRLSALPAPQGWMALIGLDARPVTGDGGLYLALDGIQDPGNLGTLLRSAWAAKADLILGPGCADAWSPKALRAGAGAQFKVGIESTPDLAARLNALKGTGVQVLGAAPKAEKPYLAVDLRGPLCWVLGAEGNGISPAVAAACSHLVHIPYPGQTESLNAAIAGAILLFETLRQRAL